MNKIEKDIMHIHMERLYQAAKELRQADGQSAVARLLNVSPQRINNWEARGISSEGLLEAQKTIGCNAIWVRDGVGEMGVETKQVQTSTLAGVSAEIYEMDRPTQMQWVSNGEAAILTAFRTTDADGRDAIRRITEIVPRVAVSSLVGSDLS